VGLLWIMHVKADLLDSIGDVRTGEHQVLEGPDEAPKVSRIGNRRHGLGGDLGLCVHHASSLKNIESKLTLNEEEHVCLMLYRV
jgi:hypothetical protein